jgi:hypothetical protein
MASTDKRQFCLAFAKKGATMAVMAKRPRMYFDVDHELKLAVELEALKRDVTASELIQDVLRTAFPDSLREAKKIIEQRKKPGRKAE